MRLLSRFALLLLTLAVVINLNCIAIKTPKIIIKALTATEGVLDLRTWDFSKNGSVNLAGDWEIYPEKIETAENLVNELKTFYNFKESATLGQMSPAYATFKLKLLLPEILPENTLYFKIEAVNSAYALFLNNKKISSLGVVGKSKLDSIPSNGKEIVPITLSPNELELILQVSDFYSTKNVYSVNLEIGHLQQLEYSSNIELMISVCFVLSFLFIFFYNLSQIKEKVSIALCISSICIIFLVGTYHSYPLSAFFPNSLGSYLFFLTIASQFFLFSCSSYIFYVLNSFLRKRWIRLLSTALFSICIGLVILTYNLSLPATLNLLPNCLFLLFHFFASYHFFKYGPSSFARIKTYTMKYKSDLELTLKELQDNKKTFDQKIIERSFNMVTYMEKLEIQTGEMEKLNELIIHLLDGANIDSVLDEIFSHIMTYYRANIAFLYFLDPETNEFYPYRGNTKGIPEAIRNSMSNARMPVSKEAGIAYIAYKRKKTIYIENAKTKYTRKKDKVTGQGISELVSSLYIPVLIRNEFQGIFFLATFNHTLNLNKDKIKFISMFTNQFTAAIQKEKLLKEMEEEKRKAEKEREKAEIAKLEAEEAKEEIEAINSLARSINENL